MYKKISLIVFFFSLHLTGSAQELVNDRQITIATPADVIAKRQALANFVWGPGGMPTDRLPQLPVIRNDTSPIAGLSDLERVDTLIIEMERGVKSYAHHFIPIVKNRRLVILHQGHFATFDDSPEPGDISYGMRRTIEGLLGDGYSVLAVYMPRWVDFTTSIRVLDTAGDSAHSAHGELFQLDKFRPKTGSPMKYFLEPVTVCLNYLSTRSALDDFPEYTDYSMVGFSGGGWTATVYSAIDTRVGLSVSVAGTIPLYLRTGAAIGDTEQTLPGFYSIAGYPDLYVLGSDGPNRKQIQIVNRKDWCCFGEQHHSPKLAGGMTYDESVRDYESRVRSTLKNLGNAQLFSLEIDEAATDHIITWDAIYDTILPELNDGRRHVASATGDEAIARGADGYPAVLINGNWSPSKLRPMTGTPALLRAAVNIYDMFYRTASNQLVHVSRPPMIWSRAAPIADGVISDPAAASRQAGTFDVVALKSDYRLYHFRRDGVQLTTEVVSDEVKGVGPPTIIASSSDQLDVLYRSWNRKLYHARKIGAQPWTVDEVGGRMLDFPTGVKMDDGSLRAFVRGVDGGLWESVRPAGENSQWSGWTSVSNSMQPRTISGSPSASVANGVVSVAARSPEGQIIVFTLKGQWTYTELEGNFIGSPTATSRGTYVLDGDGALVFLDGLNRKPLGGRLD